MASCAIEMTICGTVTKHPDAECGNNIGCRQANDNLPTEEQLDLECLNKQGDYMSYERYIEIRNEGDGN